MKTNDKNKENLIQKYDLLAQKFKEHYIAGKQHGRESLATALEKSRENLTSLEGFSVAQSNVLKKYLARDLEQTIVDANKLGEGAKEFFNPSRLTAGALSSLASILESTGDAISSLSKKTTETLTFKSGEITSAGTLTCQTCQQKIHLKSTGHIPPCPKCSAVVFHKGY